MRSLVPACSLLVALAACGACGGAGARAVASREVASDRSLDEAGWLVALSAATRAWGERPLGSTLVAVVRDEVARETYGFRLLHWSVAIDAASVPHDDEEPAVGVEVVPGRHTIVVEARVSGPPCFYCSGPGVFALSPKAFEIDVAPATAVVLRVAVDAPGSPVAPLEDRLRLVGEARAWRRRSPASERESADVAQIEACAAIGRYVEDDRRHKDIVKLLCHDDKLKRCTVLRRVAAAYVERLERARASGDGEEIDHELALLHLCARRSTELIRDAEYCVGETLGPTAN